MSFTFDKIKERLIRDAGVYPKHPLLDDLAKTVFVLAFTSDYLIGNKMEPFLSSDIFDQQKKSLIESLKSNPKAEWMDLKKIIFS